MHKKFYHIAINGHALGSILTYYDSANLELKRGEIVDVPLGKKSVLGVVLTEVSNELVETEFKDLTKIKRIISRSFSYYTLSANELMLFEWMSKYYHYPLGKIIFESLPKNLKRPRELKTIIGKNRPFPFVLNNEQGQIILKISKVLNEGPSQHYIHGVTGSGKSIVYLELIKKVLDSGKSVQFLLPEINLTPQFTKMFEDYVGAEVLTYHSSITASQKYLIWKKVRTGEGPFALLGVRSSLFAPIKNLGLIIVDEEHDASFKQVDRCPYNARDMAIKKAQILNIPIILGSATPSCENYFRFSNEIGNRNYYPLQSRAGSGNFSKYKILDTKKAFTENDPHYPLLKETLLEIKQRVDKGEQVLIFVNKLGLAHYIQCRQCGHQFKNEKCGCDNNLRYFKAKNILSCAHCDYKRNVPEICPECGSLSLLNKGFGTEKVELVLKQEFPELNVERFDRDEVANFKDLTSKLKRFNNKEINLLVGTQMLAKGHNFKNVNLVVILGVDSMLNFADFRSSEKMFQLTKQIAGRAGRYSEHSEVIIQSIIPEHPIFKELESSKLSSFYESELPLRKLCFCPPFSKLAVVYFNSRFRERAVDESKRGATMLLNLIKKEKMNTQVLGPAPSAIEKRSGQFTWFFMLKSDNHNHIHLSLAIFKQIYNPPSGVSIKIDIDPI